MHAILCRKFLEHCVGSDISVDHILHDDDESISSVTAFNDASYEVADRMFFNSSQLLYFRFACIPYSKKDIHVYDDGKYDKLNLGCNHDNLPFKAKAANDKTRARLFHTAFAL